MLATEFMKTIHNSLSIMVCLASLYCAARPSDSAPKRVALAAEDPSASVAASVKVVVPLTPVEPAAPVVVPEKKHNLLATESERTKHWLDGYGLAVGFSLKSEVSQKMSGDSAGSGAAGHFLLESSLTLDTERAHAWRGGTGFVSLHQYGGGHASAAVGDAQGFSNIDDHPGTYLYEAWFQQTLLNGKIRLKAGRVDANTEFARVENGSEFINSSMGFSPTIFNFPTYPRPRISGNIFFNPAEHLYGAFGLYDAVGGTMPIGEAGVKWANKSYPGRLGVGFWRHNGPVLDFDGDELSSTSGMYVVLDQTIWRKKAGGADGQGIGAFFQYGSSDPDVAGFSLHTGGGLQWTGAFPHREKDVLAVGLTRVSLSDADEDLRNAHELAVETLYKYQLTHWLSFTPDLQYIRNAGGTPGRSPFVGTLRMALTY